MNILYLTHRPLFPRDNELGYLVYSTINALHTAGHTCTLLVEQSTDNAPAQQHTTPPELTAITKQCVLVAPQKNTWSETIQCLRMPYPFAWRRTCNLAYQQALQTRLQQEQFDCIFTDDVRLCAYIEQVRLHTQTPPVILRVAHSATQSLHYQAEKESYLLRKIFYRNQARTMHATEQRLLAQCSGIIVMHEDDISFAASRTVQYIAPALYRAEIAHSGSAHTLFSLSDFHRPEYTASIEWLIGNVLPLLEQYFPPHEWGTDYHLGGIAPPAHILQYDNPPEHVHLHPNPADALAFITSYDIMLAPQPTLCGLPLGVLHAMAHGKAVIASPHTIRGIPCEHGIDILLAETPREFVQCIGLLLNDDALKQRIQHHARTFVARHYGAIMPLIEYMQSIVARSTRSVSSGLNDGKILSHD